jgi:glycosyltransferase involved in cell wall biosynthesis
MGPPAVSIGIPTFNRASLLQSVIDNLRNQTFGDFELVISDNASTDPRVRAVCESAAREDPRMRCYYHDRNQGAAANFWFVYEQARAPLFMWASDDDVWPQDFIERGVNALRLQPSASAWFCQVTSINFAGEVIRTLPSFRRFSSTNRRAADLVRFLWEPEVEGKANLIHALFRRETLAEVIDEWKTWPESWGADMAVVYGYLCRHDLVVDDDISLLKRAHPSERQQNIADPRAFIYPWPEARGYFRSYLAAAHGTRYRALTFATLCARWLYDVGYHGLVLRRRAPLLPPARR